LMIDQLRTEIRWNRRLERDLGRRARAVHSVFAEGLPKWKFNLPEQARQRSIRVTRQA